MSEPNPMEPPVEPNPVPVTEPNVPGAPEPIWSPDADGEVLGPDPHNPVIPDAPGPTDPDPLVETDR